MSTPIASPFDAFNARTLTAAEVARTFVPNEAFRRLAARRHSVVLGPRGSGKTTLLKMLQLPALEAWADDKAADFAAQMPFVGVFAPFDRSWQAQLVELGSDGALHEQARMRLGRVAFTTHILRALVDAMIYRTSGPNAKRRAHRVEIQTRQEVLLSESLIAAWRLRHATKSLQGVKIALGHRMQAIVDVAEEVVVRSSSDNSADAQLTILGEHEWISLSPLPSFSSGLDAWESAIGPQGDVWGLLCDELEVAPPWLRATLFGAMRSTDQRILFKLAMSPFVGQESASLEGGPQAGQDYEKISLTYPARASALDFCRSLWDALLKDKHLPPVAPAKVLGHSLIEDGSPHRNVPSDEYSSAGRHGKAFRQLCELDRDFAAYVTRKRWDINRMSLVVGDERAAQLRKIAPVVHARLFFLAEGKNPRGQQDTPEVQRHQTTRHRSRKTLEFYSGWQTVFALTEGNPRWFMAIVGDLLAIFVSDGKRLSRVRQAKVLDEGCQRLRAIVKTSIPPVGLRTLPSLPVLDLVDKIGVFLHAELIGPRFQPEPSGTISVSPSDDPSLLATIGVAMNSGALIAVPDTSGIIAEDPRLGGRFRLAFLLAAHHGVLPRLARPVALRRVLGGARVTEQLTFDANDDGH